MCRSQPRPTPPPNMIICVVCGSNTALAPIREAREAPPVGMELRPYLTGRSLLTTLNVNGAEVTGPAFTTVTGPAVAIWAAETEAVICVELTNVVVSAVPPHCTVEPATKFDPETVSVNAGPPAVAENGVKPVMVGVVVDVTAIVTLLLVELVLRLSPPYVAVSVWAPAARPVALNV